MHAGDRVLFGKWSGTEVKIDGVEYLIMKESDIMGVLEGTASQGRRAAPDRVKLGGGKKKKKKKNGVQGPTSVGRSVVRADAGIAHAGRDGIKSE